MAKQHLHVVHDELDFAPEEGKRGRGRPRKSSDYVEFMHGVEHKFMFAASDDHGHSASTHVKHLPMMAVRIEHLVEAKDLPFTSKADVWREAMYWYLEFFEQWWQDDGFTDLMEIMRKQAETIRQRNLHEAEVAVVESTAEGILEFLEKKNWKQLVIAIPHGREVAAGATIDTQKLDEAISRAEREMEQR